MKLLKRITALEEEAASFGFQWETSTQIMAQIQSECAEINEWLQYSNQPTNQAALQEEIGDLLHAVFSLCIFCKLNPEETLSQSLDKFANRLQAVKDISKERGLTHLHGLSFEELMNIWNQAKLRCKQNSALT